jgi:beta-glucosidase/6-phospho-beta-glucosidase/beta-galactosidase
MCRYHDILDCIAAHGMVPSATLHHFVHPLWWHKKGAFEKEKNIPAFVNYCALAAKHFGPRITLWCTFNEPTCALVCGYIIGAHPPGKVMALRQAGRVRGPSCVIAAALLRFVVSI